MEELIARYGVGSFVAGRRIGVMPGWFWCSGGHGVAVTLGNHQIGDDEKLQSCEIALAQKADGKVHTLAAIRMLFGSWLCHGIVVIGPFSYTRVAVEKGYSSDCDSGLLRRSP